MALEYENNAAGAKLTCLTEDEIHPGTARNKMRNATNTCYGV